MKTAQPFRSLLLVALLASFAAAPVRATLIVNGGFEAGFTGWTRLDQLGSEGTFHLQSGTTSPLNGFTVPAPPQGTNAAMTDAFGPGSHVLFQDFVVTGGMTSYTLALSLFINNGNGAPNFYTPNTLDFATPALNQRGRIDIMSATADPFSLAAGDILQNVFETTPGSSLVSGYTPLQFDLTSLLQANQGNTLRLRIAQADNVAPFNLGVDNVSLTAGTASVPDALPMAVPVLVVLGMFVVAARQRRRLAS